MARLYADEDFPRQAVEALRQSGHDVLTVHEAGQAGKGDPAVVNYAVSQGRAVVTHNRRDYIRLHRRMQPHYGIIVCTRDQDYPALAHRIHEAITNCPSLDNQLLCVNRPSVP